MIRIRSITYFFDPVFPLKNPPFELAKAFVAAARPEFTNLGYEIQTARLATTPFPKYLKSVKFSQAEDCAHVFEIAALENGFEYISLGPATPDSPWSYDFIPPMLAATQNLFATGLMTSDSGVNLPAVRSCASVIHQVSQVSAPGTDVADGFANLRFAALANVSSGAPFFPAAYHGENSPAFALAMEGASLAVEAFAQANSLKEARHNLVDTIERHAVVLTETCKRLEKTTGIPFKGLDFTMAPFPDDLISTGTALEKLGVPAIGLSGSLAAAAFLADALDRAKFIRTGFNGLMLPLMEDSTLAKRAEQGHLTVNDLLLYSSVCGTGLDTIPLAGDIPVEHLAAVLLDIAALSTRLCKPLTARLMPIPGKKAGDPTGFDFAFFANSRVLPVKAEPLTGLLNNSEDVSLRPRPLSDRI